MRIMLSGVSCIPLCGLLLRKNREKDTCVGWLSFEMYVELSTVPGRRSNCHIDFVLLHYCQV